MQEKDTEIKALKHTTTTAPMQNTTVRVVVLVLVLGEKTLLTSLTTADSQSQNVLVHVLQQ